MSNEDKRILMVCALSGAAIVANQVFAVLGVLGVRFGLLWFIAAIASGLAMTRIYRMGQLSGKEDDNGQ